MIAINVTKIHTRLKRIRVEVEPPEWQHFILT
jgi:hypothetical protein